MATGVVIRLVRERGFGFIREDDSSSEYFFHHTTVQKQPGFSFESMQEGQTRVEFEVGEGPKGPRAEYVTPE